MNAEQPACLAPLLPLAGTSYHAQEVSFLLTDLSHVELELDVTEREKAIQAGRNYAETLPVEYAPPPAYLALFDTLVADTAPRLAELVGLVTEQVIAERGPNAVLVSLARAGTPVGILMRRYAQAAHGLALAHYSVSIVRGIGIDVVALRHIAARHDPADVVFVDGWTGKGAIVTELRSALDTLAADGGPCFPATLAVLADPGHCADLFGTRADELIASACLNSTVCGLVSRTVYNTDLLTPTQFHGAKVYRELAGDDRSAAFLDAVTTRFAEAAPYIAATWQSLHDGDREVTFHGLAEVRRIQEQYGLPSWHLVKPSVGEATRVLLRRLPWKVLVHPEAADRLEHLLVLARDRGVEVVLDDRLGYSCVGIIRPLVGDDA